MKIVRHVCQAGTAAELVRAVTGDTVIAVPDDCAVGPLSDVDLPNPETRAAFWKDIFTDVADMSAVDWVSQLIRVRVQLAELLRGVDEVIIWAGEHPTEQLLRRRTLWWLKDTGIRVTEVFPGGKNPGSEHPAEKEEKPVALIPPERLHEYYQTRQVISSELHQLLGKEWLRWQEHGKGIRILQNGELAEQPMDYYDNAMLSLFRDRPVEWGRGIGAAMAETGQTDSFCRWRIRILMQEGLLSRCQEQLVITGQGERVCQPVHGLCR
ncbi:TPA: DUF1835 domain-containing protein [Klebsiella aerogenes]|nr:DUF1835 domain-containing protein [Klebsiella aerogenes]